MHMQKRLKRFFTCVLIFSTVLVLLLYYLLFFHFVEKEEYWRPKIQNFPQNGPVEQPYGGYSPWQVHRPHENYAFPINVGQVGPVQPLFAGKATYPFYCGTESSGLGQPLIDNQDGHGIPIYKENKKQRKQSKTVIGYSKDCLLPTSIRYFYKPKNSNDFRSVQEANNDIQKITLDGQVIDFIIRVEIGTINRFMYTILSLKGKNGSSTTLDSRYWNQKLVYYFEGGVGIGKKQGNLKYKKVMKHGADLLQQGYAIAYSTGTQTSVHYNIALAEDTALRVKKQFVSQFGEPRYTIGLGGSGGAIQQYLIAQNNPGALLDAAIPVYGYPDMITQTTYSFDCELLEHYFDVIDKDNPRWKRWENRSLIEGFNASSSITNRHSKYAVVTQLAKFQWPRWRGATECTNGWRGLTPLVNNPTLLRHRNFYEQEVIDAVHWSYWDDLVSVFGVDEHGYAHSTWDNVGVQYGLSALSDGKISVDEFLHLNANIGGWKPPHKQQKENFWFLTGHTDPRKTNFYSAQNMLLSPDKGLTPAKRTAARDETLKAAYASGNVFLGAMNIPVLEVRHYLEDKLDMHHMSSSFAARIRIKETMGYDDHHVLWVLEKPYIPFVESFEQMSQWLDNIETGQTLIKAKPATLNDACFDASGTRLASGRGVWDGAWNGKANGKCSNIYKTYANPRIVSGAPWHGYIFKCDLQSVDSALAKQVYGNVDMQAYRDDLKRIFPLGVCDYEYSNRDQALYRRYANAAKTGHKIMIGQVEKK